MVFRVLSLILLAKSQRREEGEEIGSTSEIKEGLDLIASALSRMRKFR
jgi:hypothetical protein